MHVLKTSLSPTDTKLLSTFQARARALRDEQITAWQIVQSRPDLDVAALIGIVATLQAKLDVLDIEILRIRPADLAAFLKENSTDAVRRTLLRRWHEQLAVLAPPPRRPQAPPLSAAYA